MNQTAVLLDQEVRRLEAANRRLTQFAQLVEAFFATDEAGHSLYLREQAQNALRDAGIVDAPHPKAGNIPADPLPPKTEAVAVAVDDVLLAANAMIFSFDEICRTEGYEKALEVFTARKRTLRTALGKWAQAKAR